MNPAPVIRIEKPLLPATNGDGRSSRLVRIGAGLPIMNGWLSDETLPPGPLVRTCNVPTRITDRFKELIRARSTGTVIVVSPAPAVTPPVPATSVPPVAPETVTDSVSNVVVNALPSKKTWLVELNGPP